MSRYICEILHGDAALQHRMDALLQREGIRRDSHLDYSCGLFEDDTLLAAGSLYRNTLRCLAVDDAHHGEGLMNQIIGHLTQTALCRGYSHLFLYTKPKNARLFEPLGFFPIAQVPDLVFMENRRHGFSDYLHTLQTQTPCLPASAAVVMHANPFTYGHRYLLETACREQPQVHLFLLSEEFSPISYALRRKMTEAGTRDLQNLVIHPSGPYLISRTTFPSYFLRDEDQAIRAQAELDTAIFLKLAAALSIRHRYVGEEPYSHVTALYNEALCAALPQGGVELHILPRLCRNGCAISASSVRAAIRDGCPERIQNLVPESTRHLLLSEEAQAARTALAEADAVYHD